MSGKNNPMADWLSRYPPRPEDLSEETAEGGGPVSSSFKRMKPQRTLDLHGMRAEEALRALEQFVVTCRRAGVRKVLVIHGKGYHSQGEPVLRGLVRRYLEQSPHTGAFGPAPRELGGSGALWVAIRQTAAGPDSARLKKK